MKEFTPNQDFLMTGNEKDRYSTVYQPAEDSFFFLRVLEKEADYIVSLKPSFCCEVGVGSGILLNYLAYILHVHHDHHDHHHCTIYFGLDINLAALQCTKQTFSNNVHSATLPLELIANNFGPALRFQNTLDVILFNPPYVPSESISGLD